MRGISGPVWEGGLGGSIRINSEVILGPFLDPYLETSSETSDLPSFGRGYGLKPKYD